MPLEPNLNWSHSNDVSDRDPNGVRLDFRNDEPSAARIAEILIRRPLDRGVVFIVVSNTVLFGCGFVVLLLTLSAGFRDAWPYAIALSLGVLYGVLLRRVRNWFALRRAIRLVRDNAHLLAQRDFAEFLSIAVGRGRGMTRLYTLQYLSAALPLHGGWGFVGRIAPATSQTTIAPIIVWFEPIPLARLAEWNLDNAPSSQARAQRARSTAGIQGHGGGFVTRWLQSAWATLALMTLLWFTALYDVIKFGRVDLPFVAVSVFLVLIGRRVFFSRAFTSTGQGYVVPGGLALRTGDAKRSRATASLENSGTVGGLHVFAQAQSSLVAIRTTASVWIIVIADLQREVRLEMNTLELNRFLAAWLSPQAPPKADRLSDLG